MMRKTKSVPDYIATAPPQARARLKQIRATIRKAAPGTTEALKWRMPAVCNHRILVMYAAFKNHISLFPTGSVLKAFKQDLKGFKCSRGTIQLPYDQPLPLALIRRITKFRVKESLEKDVKWRS